MAQEEAMSVGHAANTAACGVSPAAPGLSSTARMLRWTELVLLFGAMPGALWWARSHWPTGVNPAIIPILIVVFVLVLVCLLRDRAFDRRRLWNSSAVLGATPIILACVPIPAIMMIGGIMVWRPELLLSFPRERPAIYAAVMMLYPLLSVYPQEVIWRTFFFHRYQALFPARSHPASSGFASMPWPMIFASGLAFGWMHCIFNNWLAVALTVPGGGLFAYTYARTRSTAAVWLEHAFWGCFVFTIGLGRFFYGGSSG